MISSGYFGFFGCGVGVAAPATGQPESERCVKKEPLMCPEPSQPGVGQLTPSNLMAEAAAATAALCCSTVPPLSSTRILLRFAIGHPEALIIIISFINFRRLDEVVSNFVTSNYITSTLRTTVLQRLNSYLRCDKNFPVACPDPSQPGIGHLSSVEIIKKLIVKGL